MGSASKRPASEIYPEWERITFPAEPLSPDQKREMTSKLYDRCWSGGWQVSISDAGLVTLLALYQALIDENYADAVVIGERFVFHPEASLERHYVDRIGSLLGAARFLNGDEAFGAQTLRDVLQCGCTPLQTRRHVVFADLMSLCESKPAEKPVGEPLAQLCDDLLAGWKGRQRARLAISAATTHRELINILASTAPKPRVTVTA